MLLNSNVRLVRLLGCGGQGSVWVADHLTLHTQVAVKFLSPTHAADATSVSRFSREASAASRVKSKHVVKMFDHGVTADGVPYIVMELLEGEDLGSRIDREGVLPPAMVAVVVDQVSKALSRAHAHGLVHRDIKPENIFLCDEGDGELFVKLLDFGIVKATDVAEISATMTGTAVGTPYYMSPEQVAGAKNIDFRSDLWSLAVVAFLALTGWRAFDAESVFALSIAIHSAPIPRPTERNPQLPTRVDAWFQRACARRATERFCSAKELADELFLALGVPRSHDELWGYGPYSSERMKSMPPSGGPMSSGRLPTPPSVAAIERSAASHPRTVLKSSNFAMMSTTSAGSLATDPPPPDEPATERRLGRPRHVAVAAAAAFVLSAIGVATFRGRASRSYSDANTPAALAARPTADVVAHQVPEASDRSTPGPSPRAEPSATGETPAHAEAPAPSASVQKPTAEKAPTTDTKAPTNPAFIARVGHPGGAPPARNRPAAPSPAATKVGSEDPFQGKY